MTGPAVAGPGASPGTPGRSWPAGTTRLVGVVGDPIRHSMSPLLHNTAFRELGLDWVSVAFEVPAGGGAAVVAALAALGIEGLSVTMPLKEEVAAAVDRCTPVAARLGAVNTLLRRDGETVGDSTDGDGFVAALAEDGTLDPLGRRCLVVGAGGAARAVVDALARAGAAEVAVLGRTPDRVAAAVALAGAAGRVAVAADVAGADLVVNATPLGMGSSGPRAGQLPVDAARLHAGQVVADLVYHPLHTPLLAAAADRGAHPVDGLGMLVHQAALAVARWTGVEAPVAAMTAAARAALAG